MEDDRKIKLLERMRHDLLFFGKACLPQMYSLPTPRFHRGIADALMNPAIQKLNVIAPRGHAKSSLVACVYPLWHLFFDRGIKVIVLVSRTETHAKRLLQTMTNALEYSAALRYFFGYWGQFSMRRATTSEVELKDGSLILCRGTGQQVRGLKHLDQRPTLIVLDDPEDEANTATSERMEKNLRWLLQELVNTRDLMKGKVCVVGTPQHERCIVMMLRDMADWTTLKYRALQEDGTALWPEQWPAERLLEEKAAFESINRVSMWYREFQCEVIGDEGQLFREQDIHYYRGTVVHEGDYAYLQITELDGVPTQQKLPVNIFMGVDPASSVSRSADYSAIVPLAVDNAGRRFVLPYFRAHCRPMDLAEQVVAYYNRWRPLRTRIETVGYQEMLRDYLRTQIHIPGLERGEVPRHSKSSRLESLQPFFVHGRVLLQPDMTALREELLIYPRGKHDDLLDALYYANKGVYGAEHSASTAIVTGLVGRLNMPQLAQNHWKVA